MPFVWKAMSFSKLLITILLTAQFAAAADIETAAVELISENCLACHDGKTKTAGLDLTSRESALEGGQNGPSLVPGDPEKSLLFQRVAAGEMPLGDPLPTKKRELLREWIAAGAPWKSKAQAEERPRSGPEWWAWQPLDPSPPSAPESLPERWSRSAIDRYLYAKMREKGLKPNPPADKRTLIRRVTFDLTGLPPSPEETEAFLNDDSEDAYENLIGRLLASPRYGERWGRHWLDVVRFGESHGYEQNHLRNDAWPYRDWVIRSFNEDKPFDQMVLEQLAGDQISAGDPAIEAATGFLVAGPHDTVRIENIEGRLQQRANDLDDIIRATSEAFLGLTVGCARCHDHKFDPIQQTDYYELRAVFEGVRHGSRVWADPHTQLEHEAAERPLKRRIAQVEQKIKGLEEKAKPLAEERREAILGEYRPPVDSKGTEETFEPVEARFVRMTITDTNRGAPAIDEFEVWTAGGDSQNVALASRGAKAGAEATREDNGDTSFYRPEYAIDGEFANTWIAKENGRGRLTIELAGPALISRIVWSRDRLGANQGRFAWSTPTEYVIETSLDGENWTKAASSEGRLPLEEQEREDLLIQTVLTGEDARRWRRLKDRLAALQTELEELPDLPTAYMGEFVQPEEPTFLFKRGNPMDKGEKVTPEALSTIEDWLPPLNLDSNTPEGERRLALANWITDNRNPLTPRVLANRIWHYHFGQGIVNTPSDFGYNGGRPTHPELLDYLARRLQLLGWRLKPFHKEILMSAAYRQASDYSERHAEVDSEARYLWRFPPRRLEAEVIRDSILAVSGKLNLKMGGPSFRLYKYTVDNVATYLPVEGYGPKTFRRAVYHQAARSVAVDLLGQFDKPDCAHAAPKREVSVSPLQALSLMNNEFAVEQAEFFAERLRREAGEDAEAQVERAYLLAFGRPPDAKELEASAEFISAQGLELFCRVIFNANEFIYVM